MTHFLIYKQYSRPNLPVNSCTAHHALFEDNMVPLWKSNPSAALPSPRAFSGKGYAGMFFPTLKKSLIGTGMISRRPWILLLILTETPFDISMKCFSLDGAISEAGKQYAAIKTFFETFACRPELKNVIRQTIDARLAMKINLQSSECLETM